MNLTLINASLTRKILLCIFILGSFLLITCRKENDKPDKSKTGNNPLEALDYISDENLAKGNLGNIVFTVDPTLTDSATFYANSEDYTVLMVEDANGYGWMLSIPPHALMEDQLITMTALSSIDVSNTAARVRSGVIFEPDGIQFTDRVMLTVQPPVENPGKGIIFTFNHDGSHVAFAENVITESKNARGYIWHFSGAGYDNEYESGSEDMETYKRLALQEYKLAIALGKNFLKEPAPTPPSVPSVPITCSEIHTFDKQIALYEFSHYFLEPYYEIISVILNSVNALRVIDPNHFDSQEGLDIYRQIIEKAENELWKLGDICKKNEPPDPLYYLIHVAFTLEKQKNDFSDPHILDWHRSLYNYYYKHLKDEHEYCSFPLLIQLAQKIGWLAGPALLEQIVDAMTFEVIVTTNFSAIWYTGGESSISGNVVQKANVKNIKLNFVEEGRGWLWGEADNMLLKSESGTFTNSKGVVDLKGQQIPCSVWLINWDPCIQSTFDVMLGGFHLGHNESSTISGPASDRSFEDYWYVKAGLFSFEIPMKNYSEVLGEKTFSGTGSVDDVFSSTGEITIKIIHTPQ